MKILKVKKITILLAMLVVFIAPIATVNAWGVDPGGSCCDGGGADYGWGGGDNDPHDRGDNWPNGGGFSHTPVPSCSISATPNPVEYDGTVTLRWTTSNATGASINNGIGYVQVGVNKTMSIPNLKSETTYVMTVTGAGGTRSCQVKVKVNPRPSCTLTVNPDIVDRGGNVTLSWTTENADSASISGIGTVGLSGSYTVSNLQSTKTYTMTVNGNGITNTCSATVTVNEPPVEEPSCSISANPSHISYGGDTVLSWTTSNAVSASINYLGTVSTGSASRVINNLTSTRTYIMTVLNSEGVSRTCQTTVYVSSVEAPSCSVYISPSVVDYGDDATIVWSSANASSVYISGIGYVSSAGSRILEDITSSKTYTVTVKSDDGQSSTCSARVRVREENLSCDIWASPNPNTNGETTLHWNSDNASWAIINNGIGSVSVDGSKRITGLSNGTKVYTLTVGNSHSGGQTKTCSVTVRTNKTYVPTTYPSCSITASRTYIQKGEGTTLYWTSQNADTAVFADNGSVALSGSRVVYPTESGYYKLVVTDDEGHQSSCQTYVTVANPSTVVTVSSVPYTGPRDALWAGLMSLVFFGAVGTLYSRRRQVMELINL